MTASLLDSIILIRGSETGPNNFGTGFIFHHDQETGCSYIITCCHVLETAGWSESAPDGLTAGGCPATVIARDTRIDLAILAARNLSELPSLSLTTINCTQTTFKTAGYLLTVSRTKKYSAREMPGGLTGRSKVDDENPGSIKSWDFKLDNQFVQKGYSGAPLVDEATNAVFAVAFIGELQVTKDGNPGRTKKGIAIDIENLKRIWPDKHLPPSLFPGLFAVETVKPSPPPSPPPVDLPFTRKVDKPYRVFVSYADSDKRFVELLASHLRQMGCEVWYEEEALTAADKREENLMHRLGNWADICLFVISEAARQEYVNPGTMLARQVEWARVRQIQFHRHFKQFCLYLGDSLALDSLHTLQAVNFNNWQNSEKYKRGLRHLYHRLRHHQNYPDLWVNRRKECEQCLDLLGSSSNIPGVLIYNQGNKRGLGNSMLLWHLEESYLPQHLPQPALVVPTLVLDEVVQDQGPIEWMNYVRLWLEGQVNFTRFETVWSETLQTGRLNRAVTQRQKHPHKAAIRANSSLGEITLERRGQTYKDPRQIYADPAQLTPGLPKLTQAFIEDLKDSPFQKIVWPVSGPSEKDWSKTLGGYFDWLRQTFFALSYSEKIYMIIAGTWPMPDMTPGVPMIELAPFSQSDIKEYVQKRYRDQVPTDISWIVTKIWEESQGEPQKMYEIFEGTLKRSLEAAI